MGYMKHRILFYIIYTYNYLLFLDVKVKDEKVVSAFNSEHEGGV